MILRSAKAGRKVPRWQRPIRRGILSAIGPEEENAGIGGSVWPARWRFGAASGGAGAEERRHPADVLPGQPAQRLDPRGGDDLDGRARSWALFNNLVRVRPAEAAEQPRDDRARPRRESGRWSADGKELTFKLREGVKWHDGKPFTAEDVECTFDLLTGKGERKLRTQPAQVLVRQRREGHDQRRLRGHLPPQAAAAVAAWRCSPRATRRSIPATCRPAQMRTKPVGTGPFKFVEFKQNGDHQARPQHRLLEEGQALSRRHRVSPSCRTAATAILGFVSGRFDMTFALGRHHPAAEGHQGAGAQRAVRGRVDEQQHQPDPEPRRAAVRQSRDPPRAWRSRIDRKAFIDIINQGDGRCRRHDAAAARRRLGPAARRCSTPCRATAPTSRRTAPRPARS